MLQQSQLKRTRTTICFIFTLIFVFTSHLAKGSTFIPAPTGYSFAIGKGEPNGLQGGRVATQWDWNLDLFSAESVELVGYWDLSLAYWEGDGDEDRHRHRALGAVAFAPFFRLQGTPALSADFSPYLQASVGLALLTHNHFGRRDLGKNWQFQDFLGGGVQFGEDLAWDIGLHYLHYSNTGINPPNQGLDVKLLLMLMYHM